MHEMALAQGILEIVLKTAVEQRASKVTSIKLLIGQMIQVEPECLTFGFEALAMGTVAEGAQVTIEITPLIGQCNSCGEQFAVEKYCFICPRCNSTSVVVVSGRELAVDYLEVE